MNEETAIKSAICSYVALNLDDRLTDEEFIKVLKFIDNKTFEKIDDVEFISNNRLKRLMDYTRLNHKHVVRLMTRDLSIFKNLDLNKFNFKVQEIKMFLNVHPNQVRKFNFNLEELNGGEIVTLLKADLNYVYEIDFSDKKFAHIDYTDIIKNFYDVDQIMDKIDLKKIDNHQACALILLTGNKYIEKVDLHKLNDNDWLEILKQYPEFISYCNMQVFELGDCYNLVKLSCEIPNMFSYIDKNKNKISAIGWEKLLLHDDKLYSGICNFDLLKDTNWRNILSEKPDLEKFKA